MRGWPSRSTRRSTMAPSSPPARAAHCAPATWPPSRRASAARWRWSGPDGAGTPSAPTTARSARQGCWPVWPKGRGSPARPSARAGWRPTHAARSSTSSSMCSGSRSWRRRPRSSSCRRWSGARCCMTCCATSTGSASRTARSARSPTRPSPAPSRAPARCSTASAASTPRTTRPRGRPSARRRSNSSARCWPTSATLTGRRGPCASSTSSASSPRATRLLSTAARS